MFETLEELIDRKGTPYLETLRYVTRILPTERTRDLWVLGSRSTGRTLVSEADPHVGYCSLSVLVVFVSVFRSLTKSL